MTHSFRFTRHILSCNNIDEGKMIGKDVEPGLAIYGITDTIKFSLDKNKIHLNLMMYVSLIYIVRGVQR